MLDPYTLKEKDVVVFGKEVEKTVNHCCFSLAISRNDYISFEDHEYITDVNDPIWKIAELKKPNLPEKVGKYGWDFTLKKNQRCDSEFREVYYLPESSGVNYFTPVELLLFAKTIVKKLEEAGV